MKIKKYFLLFACLCSLDNCVAIWGVAPMVRQDVSQRPCDAVGLLPISSGQ